MNEEQRSYIEHMHLDFPVSLELSEVFIEGDRLYFAFIIQEQIENDEYAKGYDITAAKQVIKLFIIIGENMTGEFKQQCINHFSKYIGKPIEELKKQISISLQNTKSLMYVPDIDIPINPEIIEPMVELIHNGLTMYKNSYPDGNSYTIDFSYSWKVIPEDIAEAVIKLAKEKYDYDLEFHLMSEFVVLL